MNNTFVVEAIRASLGEAYLVGGTIRDTLMGIEGDNDLDFATPLTPEEVSEKLRKDGYRVVDFSSKFGTISTTISRVKVEITTFRNETYEKGSRKPDVEFIQSLKEDLARRDFTINAIAHDGEKYIDPFDGQGDIIRGKIKAVGDPDERFAEDPLRILRALRFVSTLGFTVDAATYDAMYTNAHLLGSLSGERVAVELDKLLQGEHWVQAISLGIETKIFEYLFGITGVDAYIDDFLEAVSTYDQTQLQQQNPNRWLLVILACINAAREVNKDINTGRVTLDIIHKLQTRLKWTARHTENITSLVLEESRKESINNLQAALDALPADDIQRYVLTEKILKVKLRNAFSALNMTQVQKTAEQLLESQNKTYELRSKTNHDTEELIRKDQQYSLSSIKYICAVKFYEGPRITTKAMLHKAYNGMLEDKALFRHPHYKFSTAQKAQAIEEGLIMLMRALPDRIITLDEATIVDGNKHIPRTRERLQFIRWLYTQQLIELKKPPYLPGVEKARAKVHENIARINEEFQEGVRDYSYYSHVIDMHKWRSLACSDKKEFFTHFEAMNDAMDAYEEENGGLTPGNVRGFYVDTARCLVHLLQIEDTIDEKISVARSIINNYHMAGSTFERNIPRYRLLQDWLTIAKHIIDCEVGKAADIQEEIRKMRSYRYTDIDEDYIVENMPEINTIRNNLHDAEAMLAAIADTPAENTVQDDSSQALKELLDSALIDKALALEIYKKIVQIQATANVNLEPLSFGADSQLHSLEPEKLFANNESYALIQQGETEHIEFKQGWKYDVALKQNHPADEVRKGATKAIAAFMNSSGGTLIIGVSDSAEITGLENADYLIHKKKNYTRLQLQDELKKDIDNALHTAIGAATAFVTIKFEYYDDDKTVAVLTVRQSPEEVFYDNKYYIRSSASCRELQGQEMLRHIRNRKLIAQPAG